MKSTVNSAKKSKIGRPKVETQAINVRLHISEVGKIDEFRRSQPDIPTRPEAIRRLIKLGLDNNE